MRHSIVRTSLRKGVVLVLLTALALYGYPEIAGRSAHAAAVPAPATSDPETTRNEVKSCPPRYFNDPPNWCDPGGRVLKSRIPIDPGDAAGVDALYNDAWKLVAGLHDFDPSDLRIGVWGDSEVWGAMHARLVSIIETPADKRTPEERGAYHWFQQVVQQYRIKSAKNALQEYKNWQGQQCAYNPGVPSPPLAAYDGGAGCLATNPAALFAGAHPPTFDQLQQWGSYKAAQTLGAPNSTASEIGGGVAAALAFGGAAAAVAAGTIALTGAGLSAGTLSALVGGIGYSAAFGGVQAVLSGSLILSAIVALPIVIFVLAIVALVTGIVQQFGFAEIPGKLQGALDTAQGSLPDLKSMLHTQDGAKLLTALFIGQTNPLAGGSTSKPNWHGDLLRSQSMDTSVSPAAASGSVVSSKAVSVKSWGNPWDDITKATPPGGSPPALTWLTDQGWFQESIKPNTWTTESSLRYLDWDGKKRVALIQGDKFIDMQEGTQCQPASSCQTTSTLKLLDANGTPITVSMDPSAPVRATITDDSSGAYKAGKSTTFTDPAIDSRGRPVTYKWEFEDRCSFCLPPFDPQTLQFDGSFHGHGVVTKFGQTVSYTWPATGTFHVRLTTTNEAGSKVADLDVQVGQGDAPTIAFGRMALGPILPGESVLLTGCVTTAPGLRPTVSIDWGDGTIDTAEPPTIYLQLSGGVLTAPGQKFLVQPGSPQGGGCSGTWSFVANHTYSTRSDAGYPVSVTANDGERQSATAAAGTVAFKPPELAAEFVVTNATRFTEGTADGRMPVFKEGETVKFEARFNADPARDGASVEIDWGNFGIHTAFVEQCNVAGCTIGQTLSADHVFSSKPGAGSLSTYTPTLTVRDSNGDIKFQKTVKVAIENVRPTISGLTFDSSPTAQGQAVTLSGTVSTSDPHTPLAIKVNWGGVHDAGIGVHDGGIDALNLPPGEGERTFRSTHVYRAWSPSTRSVGVDVYDDSGEVSQAAANLFVNNVPPSPQVDPVTVDQGSHFTLGIVTGDPGLDPFRATIDWGDGSSPDTQDYAPTTDPVLKSPTHTYAVPGRYDVGILLDDGPDRPAGQHGTGTASTTVTVNNVSPVVELDPASGDRRTPLTLTGKITDPGTQDSFTGTVDWRDGTAPESFTKPAGTTTFSLTHSYDQGGVYPVAVKASDGRGGTSDEATAEVTVNGPPSFRANNPGDVALGEAVGYQFAAQGFPLPSYALTEGTLPPGLTLGSDGFLSGTPTTAGTYRFKVSASNQYGSQVAGPITITVRQAPAFTADSPPGDALVGTPYRYRFSAVGVPAPTFGVASGSLPPGLELSSEGVLSGTPTMTGTYTFQVSATNAAKSVSTADLTILVKAPLTVKAPNARRPYGAANPTFRPTYRGFLDGDDASVLDRRPTCTTTAKATSVRGSYPITCAGAASSKYAFAYVPGRLTVTRPRCQGVPATRVGTRGPDLISGTPGRDVIVSGGGNDLVRAGGGDDLVCGGRGNDRILGAGGADRLVGGPGADRLRGGPGADRLVGGEGPDLLRGEAGDDRLAGEAGDNRLSGGAGADLLRGGPDLDRLIGGTGDDTLRAGSGADLLRGGTGHDRLFGGDGPDLLVGEAGNDRLVGEAGDDRLSGGDGLDLLLGGSGNDRLFGGTGADTLRGGPGLDRLSGGTGEDKGSF